MKKFTVKEIKKEVRRLDPELDGRSTAFRTAVMLLASAVVGTNYKKIKKFTGYRDSSVLYKSSRKMTWLSI